MILCSMLPRAIRLLSLTRLVCIICNESMSKESGLVCIAFPQKQATGTPLLLPSISSTPSLFKAQPASWQKLRVPLEKVKKKTQLNSEQRKEATPPNMSNHRRLYPSQVGTPRIPQDKQPFCDAHIYFFLPLDLDFEPAAAELLDATLDAREGDVELALLPVADFTLSRALFCRAC